MPKHGRSSHFRRVQLDRLADDGAQLKTKIALLIGIFAGQTASADVARERYKLSEPSGAKPVGEGDGKHFPMCAKKYAYRLPSTFEVLSPKEGEFFVDNQPWDSKGDKDVIKLFKREETEREVFLVFARKSSGTAYLLVLVKKDNVTLCGIATEMNFLRE